MRGGFNGGMRGDFGGGGGAPYGGGAGGPPGGGASGRQLYIANVCYHFSSVAYPNEVA
jgi:hypothetical protein